MKIEFTYCNQNLISCETTVAGFDLIPETSMESELLGQIVAAFDHAQTRHNKLMLALTGTSTINNRIDFLRFVITAE